MDAVGDQGEAVLGVDCEAEAKGAFEDFVRGACDGVFEQAFLAYLSLEIKVVPIIASRASPVPIVQLNPFFLALVLTVLKMTFWQALGATFTYQEPVSAGHTDSFLSAFLAVSDDSITHVAVSGQEIPGVSCGLATLAIVVVVSDVLSRCVKITDSCIIDFFNTFGF